jgi:hypothetical protein
MPHAETERCRPLGASLRLQPVPSSSGRAAGATWRSTGRGRERRAHTPPCAARLIEEAERQLSSLADQRQTLRLLSEIALNAPLPFDHTRQDEALAALHHAGVLLRVGGTLRFRRDVEGDLLLAYLLDQPAQRAIIEHQFAVQNGGDALQRQLRNLSAAGQGYAATMIRELTQRWLAEPAGSLSHRIRLLPYCAEAAPEQVAEMCLNAAHARVLTADDTGPIVLALGYSDGARGLRLLWDLAALDAAMAPLSIHDAVNRLLNPCFHGPDELTAACVLLEAWLRDSISGRRAEMLAEAVLALFTTVATWNTYDSASFTMHEQELPAVPALLDIRRTATQLLGEMLAHGDVGVRTRAIAVLAKHGAPHLGRVTNRAFDSAAADEFLSLVPIIEARLAAESEMSLLASLYMMLATRWAAGRPGADDAGRLLVGRKIEPLIKAYHYSSRNEWFYSFDEAFAMTPENDRWSWWVQRYLHNRSDAECSRVVSDLRARYRTAQEVAQCISTIAGTDRPEWIIDAWCRCESTLFEEALPVLSDGRARKYVENALRRERYRVDPSKIIADLRAMPQAASLDDINGLLSTSNLSDVAVAVAIARYLVDQLDVAVRRRGLDCIQYRDDADPADVLGILEHALRDGDWGHHWAAILDVLEKPNRRSLIDQCTVLRQRIEKRFLIGKEWVDHVWYEDRVLEILYGDEHAKRLDLLGRLLANGTFGAIQEVGHLIAALVVDAAQFGCVVERLVGWARDLGETGVDTVGSVLEVALHDKDLPSEARTIAMGMLRDGDEVARGLALVLLGQLQANPETCATLARIAADPADGVRERAASTLWSLRWPRGGLSRVVGEPPKKLVTLREILREAQKLASGDARSLVSEVLRDVEQALAAYDREDEEVLLPR